MSTWKRLIQGRKRKSLPVSDQEAFTSLATFHILNGMKVVAEKECLDLRTESEAQDAREKAVEFIGEMVEQERDVRGELYTHDRCFKQRSTNTLIREHILKAYET